MSQTHPAKTIHLLDDAPMSAAKSTHKRLKMSDLRSGETARVVGVDMPDTGCRKRLAELGLAEGTKFTVASTGGTLMLIIGGTRMGLSAHCAREIVVIRVA